jgi:hypothetical protein
LSLSSAKNAGHTGLNWITQPVFSTSIWYAFAGHVNRIKDSTYVLAGIREQARTDTHENESRRVSMRRRPVDYSDRNRSASFENPYFDVLGVRGIGYSLTAEREKRRPITIRSKAAHLTFVLIEPLDAYASHDNTRKKQEFWNQGKE